ncbi:methylmalonyl-CoA mutase family protein [Myroides sp. C15-4]|uniref:methylmalonyl-CoA mutase family protein n=1 Tax=Myroides sp. C15-4 TaxID=3400532 RepID=UPI003D2F55C3
MKRKDLQHLKIDSTLFETPSDSTVTTTVEGIAIQKQYSEEAIKALEDIDFAAGFAPFIRGISPMMYVQHPWQMNQVPQNTSLEKANQVYRNQVQQGQKEITLIAHTTPSTEIEKTQPSLHSIDDMKVLLAQLPLDELAVALYSGGSIVPLLACYLAAAEELGFEGQRLSGHLHSDLLSPILSTKGTFSLEKANKVALDTLSYLHQHHPNFNGVSLSNTALKTCNLTADQELAYSLMLGIDLLQQAGKQNIPLDYIATHLSYTWALGSNHFIEIAKMRAARGVWSTLLQPFNLKDEQASALSIRAQTSVLHPEFTGSMDSLGQTTVQATAAIFGGTQALHLQLPPTASTQLTAGQMQRFLVEEIKSCKTIDPWAGSYFIEKTTLDIAEKTINLIQTIANQGGIQPVLTALLQSQHKGSKSEATETKTTQLNPRKAVEDALAKLSHSVQTQGKNVLALAIEAAKARATLEEIHQAIVN